MNTTLSYIRRIRAEISCQRIAALVVEAVGEINVVDCDGRSLTYREIADRAGAGAVRDVCEVAAARLHSLASMELPAGLREGA